MALWIKNAIRLATGKKYASKPIKMEHATSVLFTQRLQWRAVVWCRITGRWFLLRFVQAEWNISPKNEFAFSSEIRNKMAAKNVCLEHNQNGIQIMMRKRLKSAHLALFVKWSKRSLRFILSTAGVKFTGLKHLSEYGQTLNGDFCSCHVLWLVSITWLKIVVNKPLARMNI